MSLQHELIHGIPPGWHGLTSCWGRCRWRSGIPMASIATAIWRTIANHLLTHPEDDPESYYVTAESWQRFSLPGNAALSTCAIPSGASAAGAADGYRSHPAQRAAGFPRGRPPRHRHVEPASVVADGLLAWMAAQGFSPLWFVLAVSYPALALTKVRSFLEHRAADDPLARSVINEAGLSGECCSSISTTMRCIMTCRGSPGTLYVGCICIARRPICSVIRGSRCVVR